jgi:hypothetical protein
MKNHMLINCDLNPTSTIVAILHAGQKKAAARLHGKELELWVTDACAGCYQQELQSTDRKKVN